MGTGSHSTSTELTDAGMSSLVSVLLLALFVQTSTFLDDSVDAFLQSKQLYLLMSTGTRAQK